MDGSSRNEGQKGDSLERRNFADNMTGGRFDEKRTAGDHISVQKRDIPAFYFGIKAPCPGQLGEQAGDKSVL